jgi:hypothetical protein
MICRNDNVINILNHFFETKKIPNIIFHGNSGSGKRTIVNNFLSKIYDYDSLKLKSNVMMVNCSHGKGIKFIREELKFFAKTNIQVNDIIFKSIVLLNADSLTIDAQSALRRCIELFSYNTRFFIIVENKCRLLNPILSRFCEIHIPGYDNMLGERINLHSNNLQLNIFNSSVKYEIENFEISLKFKLLDLIDLSTHLYENGYYAKQIVEYFVSTKKECGKCLDYDLLNLFYYKLKKDFRCEKMLMFYILKVIYFDTSSNDTIKNILLI